MVRISEKVGDDMSGRRVVSLRDSDGFSVPGVKCIKETTSAMLCRIDDAEEWIPKSQVHDDSFVFHSGHEGTLVVTQWLARERGWI